MKKKFFKNTPPPKKRLVIPAEKSSPKKTFWMYGYHPIIAALKNASRHKERLLLTPNKKEEFLKFCNDQNIVFPSSLSIEEKDTSFFTALFPPQTVHQGIALLVHPLAPIFLEDILENASDDASFTLVLLDGITDPHNVGAILRSAAAFGANALCLIDHHGASLSAVAAKSASGALDTLPIIEIKNLAQTLESLKKHGVWCFGLDERGTEVLGNIEFPQKCALILGNEGEGLRRLTKERCDNLIYIPTNPQFPTLNVSTSAAVCLYERTRLLLPNI